MYEKYSTKHWYASDAVDIRIVTSFDCEKSAASDSQEGLLQL